MPRANRYVFGDCVWHITHRCHKKEFLLKFSKDRQVWRKWLFECKKRFGLSVLNYVVTSNHIHLLVWTENVETLAISMQLLAGRTGQSYNVRKKRKGAFWEDRYHATAVESGEYLLRCMIYIDLNMVRAGVVSHPRDWADGGHLELLEPRERYGVIDFERLLSLLEFSTYEEFRVQYAKWVAEALDERLSKKDEIWSRSIAVGGKEFVESVKGRLGVDALYRDVADEGGMFCLRDLDVGYCEKVENS